MTDFIPDLEAELLAAARRRAAHGRRRWTPPRVRLAPVAAILLVAVAAVAAVRGLDGLRTANERPVPPVGSSVPVPLQGAMPAACGGPGQVATQESEPRSTPTPPSPPREWGLSVMRRPRDVHDAIGAAAQSALPAGTVYPDAARRAGRERFAAAVHLVPVSGLRAECGGDAQGEAICITIEERRLRDARCFPQAAIDRGYGILLSSPGRVHGIAPDGVDRVRLEWSDGAAEVPVVDNVYEARHSGLRAGMTVHVRLQRPRTEGCVPSPAVYDAVPVLRGGSGGVKPDALVEAMAEAGARGEWRRYAHLVRIGELDVWIVPSLPCDNAREQHERVCIVPVRGDRVGGFACHRPADVRVRGAWMVFPDRDRAGIAGIAPAASGGVTVTGRGGLSETLGITGGVFGAVLPEGFRVGEVGVRFLDGPNVVILNGTEIDGLATDAGDRIPGDEEIGNYPRQDVERTTVYYAYEDATRLAEHVAGSLRVSDVRAAPPDVIDQAQQLVEGTGIVVVVGGDMARVRAEDVGLLDATDGLAPDALTAIRDEILPGAEVATAATGERRAKSWVRYAPGWGRPAREVMRALGLGAGEQTGDTTPEPALGTPIVVVIGDDLARRFSPASARGGPQTP